MSVTVTCECGQITELDDAIRPASDSDVQPRRCFACGRLLSEPLAQTGEDVPKRGAFQQLWQSRLQEADPSASSPADSIPPSSDVAADQSTPTTKARSLWEVMQAAAEPPRSEPVAATISEPTTDSAVEPKPKGLWGVMHIAEPREDEAPAEPRTSEPLGSAGASPSETLASQLREIEATPVEVVTRPTMVPPPLLLGSSRSTQLSSATESRLFREPLVPVEERRWSARAVTAMLVALSTVLAASCSLQAGVLPRVPSLVAGVIGLMLGFMASSEVKRSRGRLKGRGVARLSIVLSALGMFLAPMVFAQWGESLRRTAAEEEISSRLQRIGEGLEQFHAQQGAYPSAVIVGRAADGLRQPMHGWMTPLLPFIGQQAVHHRIDLRQPFDAPANVPAMQQVISDFAIPGRQPVRSPRGFGVTHFAGVGGTAVRDGVGLVHLGIFGDDQTVKKAQVIDGLAQTLVAGEIPDAHPAWGEPGNIRSIGDGLNKQFKGFGNPSGNGATFLHADGSVRFYSSKADRRILENLETRDGGEP